MSNEDLKQHLAELHKTLEDAGHLSSSEKDVLGHLMEEMVEIAAGEPVKAEHADGVREQLERQATDFELKHPRLSAVLRQIMEALEKMGI